MSGSKKRCGYVNQKGKHCRNTIKMTSDYCYRHKEKVDFNHCNQGSFDIMFRTQFKSGDPITQIYIANESKARCLNVEVLKHLRKEKHSIFVQWVKNPLAQVHDDEGHGWMPFPDYVTNKNYWFVRLNLDDGSYVFIRQASIPKTVNVAFTLQPLTSTKVRIGDRDKDAVFDIGKWHGQEYNAQILYELVLMDSSQHIEPYPQNPSLPTHSPSPIVDRDVPQMTSFHTYTSSNDSACIIL